MISVMAHHKAVILLHPLYWGSVKLLKWLPSLVIRHWITLTQMGAYMCYYSRDYYTYYTQCYETTNDINEGTTTITNEESTTIVTVDIQGTEAATSVNNEESSVTVAIDEVSVCYGITFVN